MMWGRVMIIGATRGSSRDAHHHHHHHYHHHAFTRRTRHYHAAHNRHHATHIITKHTIIITRGTSSRDGVRRYGIRPCSVNARLGPMRRLLSKMGNLPAMRMPKRIFPPTWDAAGIDATGGFTRGSDPSLATIFLGVAWVSRGADAGDRPGRSPRSGCRGGLRPWQRQGSY
eukprot:1184542-Prorocentrum_minimum.AAC.1